MNTLRIGLVSISDRASSGVYQDKGIPALEEWLTSALTTPFELETRLIPDEQAIIEQTLCELVDEMSCHLVLTTGGTGPARRDVTPDATLAVADREMPGFGEQMRQISLHFVPTAILSRQVGVIRKQALILNLPGQPKSIKETLDTYSVFICCASLHSVCSSNVDFPAPGLPPIRMALPGTTPPPNTRSNSLNPVEKRGSSSRLMSESFWTFATPALPA